MSRRVKEIRVAATVSIDELFLEEDEAFALIEAIDLGQAEAGFTEKVIINLIKSMLKEFKGYDSELEDFKKTIMDVIK